MAMHMSAFANSGQVFNLAVVGEIIYGFKGWL